MQKVQAGLLRIAGLVRLREAEEHIGNYSAERDPNRD